MEPPIILRRATHDPIAGRSVSLWVKWLPFPLVTSFKRTPSYRCLLHPQTPYRRPRPTYHALRPRLKASAFPMQKSVLGSFRRPVVPPGNSIVI